MDLVEKLQRLTTREKTISALTALFVLVFVPYMFLYSPAQEKLRAKRQDLSSLNDEITALSAAVRFGIGEGQPMEMSAIALPEATNLAGIVEALGREAALAGVDLVSVTQEGLSQKGQYTEMHLKLELKARYRPIHDFVRQLGDKNRLFMIQSFRYETNAALYPSGVAIIKAVAYLKGK